MFALTVTGRNVASLCLVFVFVACIGPGTLLSTKIPRDEKTSKERERERERDTTTTVAIPLRFRVDVPTAVTVTPVAARCTRLPPREAGDLELVISRGIPDGEATQTQACSRVSAIVASSSQSRTWLAARRSHSRARAGVGRVGGRKNRTMNLVNALTRDIAPVTEDTSQDCNRRSPARRPAAFPSIDCARDSLSRAAGRLIVALPEINWPESGGVAGHR